MAELFEVSSLQECEDICKRFSQRGKAYFRGQVRDYPQVLPSLFRLSTSPPMFEDVICRLYLDCYQIGDWKKICERRVQTEAQKVADSYGPPPRFAWLEGWESASWNLGDLFNDERVVPSFGSVGNYDRHQEIQFLSDSFTDNWSHHSDALLQHYGLPSRALDVTTDPLVAIWFASNSFQRNSDKTAFYVPAHSGDRVVYVFMEPAAELINLQMIATAEEFGPGEEIPYFGLRGIAQRGLLMLGATKDSPDLRRHVSAVIRMTPGAWAEDPLRLRGYTYQTLIPSPKKDQFYAALLEHQTNPMSEFSDLAGQIIKYV